MLTPIDIREKEFEKGRGYTKEVKDFLNKVASEYELLYSENAELLDKVSQLEARLANYEKLEDTIQNTLVLAQKTADSTIETAKNEAETLVLNARAKADKLYIELLDNNNRMKIANKALYDRFNSYKEQIRNVIKSNSDFIEDIDVFFNEKDINVDIDNLELYDDLTEYDGSEYDDLHDDFLDEDIYAELENLDNLDE